MEENKVYTKDDILNMFYKTYIKFRNCPGGEGYFEIDGVEYNTDTGYALEGMEILINHIHHHVLEEKKDVDTNTEQAEDY